MNVIHCQNNTGDSVLVSIIDYLRTSSIVLGEPGILLSVDLNSQPDLIHNGHVPAPINLPLCTRNLPYMHSPSLSLSVCRPVGQLVAVPD